MSGTHSVTINNHDGNLTLNGAQIVNKTPDINHADGTVTQGVASNGSITSTADISKNQITTGQLIGNSLNNHSVWSGLNVSGSETVKSQYTVAGTATEAKDNKLLPGNVVNNAKGPQAIGNVVTHNEHTVTDAVIGGNIVVNAGSTTGKISNDAEAANGYIKDRFDANKMQNNFNHQNDIAQNITTILTNIVNAVAPDKGQSQQTPPGQISDHDIGMMVSSGVGSIGGALFGKGDVGATVAGVAAGDMANIYLPNIGQTIADQISPNQKNPKDPKNSGSTANQGGKGMSQGNVTQTNANESFKNQTYDTVTDINKIIASFAHDVIVGGVGALTGIIAGGGNVGLDATAGGLTSLKQNAPKITKPKNQKNNVDATQGDKDAPKP